MEDEGLTLGSLGREHLEALEPLHVTPRTLSTLGWERRNARGGSRPMAKVLLGASREGYDDYSALEEVASLL